MRNQTVQDESGKESSQNSFHSHKLHQSATKENHCQYEYELHHTVVILPEKPTSDTGEKENNQKSEESDFCYKKAPKPTIDSPFEHTTYDCKNNQGKGNGYCRTANRYIDTAQTRQTITTDYRISNQRMGSVHTRQ